MREIDQWVLLIQPGEDGAIKSVNKILRKHRGKKTRFELLDESSWGGTKHPIMEVYGLAIAPLDPSIMFAAIKSADWMEPQSCVLVYTPDDGGWQFFPIDKLIKENTSADQGT